VAPRITRKLIVGDNLETLASLPSESVALVYLDPPFNSGRSYDVVRNGRDGGDGRTEAFHDQWTWGAAADRQLKTLASVLPRDVADLVAALVAMLGRRDLGAYLVMMAPRLVELRRVLHDSGSLYLHCDSSASHYLKLLLDAIFGPGNFRNEIVWKRTHAHSSSRRFGPVHDTLLFFSKSARYRWNPGYSAYPSQYIERYYTHEDERGRYQLITCTAPGDRIGTKAHYDWRGKLPPPGRHWAWKKEQMEAFVVDGRIVHSSNGIPRLKRYVDDAPGIQLQDVWTDINRLDAHSDERVGYETQKPLALLSRLIEASTDPGDLVLDPFLGSGTTAVAAERAGRAWIGIDQSLLAGSIALARARQVVSLDRVTLDGFPADVDSALRLLSDQPQAFGLWGTSMLATLADRKGQTDALITGDGRLRVRRRDVQVKSWVPLTDGRLESYGGLPRGSLSKVGFVLRAKRLGAGLRTQLEERLEIPVHEVPLASLVDSGSRARGMAREVAELSSA
jgi:DNA modification methylase